jgi:hypothetical protein
MRPCILALGHRLICKANLASHRQWRSDHDIATRKYEGGWCVQHVQAISVAEKAMCNRNYFLNKPYGIGGGNKTDIP